MLMALGAKTNTSRGAAPMRPPVSMLPMLWLPHEGSAPPLEPLLASCSLRCWNSCLTFSLAILARKLVSMSRDSSPARACVPTPASTTRVRVVRIRDFIAASPVEGSEVQRQHRHGADRDRGDARSAGLRSAGDADALGRRAAEAGGGVGRTGGEDRRVL